MATSHGGRSHMCEGATDIQAHMCFRSWPCRFLCRYAPDTSAPTAIFMLVFKPQNILARHEPRVHGPSRALESSNRSNIAKILRNWQRLQRPYVCDIARSTGKPVSTPSMFVVAQQQKNPSFSRLVFLLSLIISRPRRARVANLVGLNVTAFGPWSSKHRAELCPTRIRDGQAQGNRFYRNRMFGIRGCEARIKECSHHTSG